jgi:hypothetical protein
MCGAEALFLFRAAAPSARNTGDPGDPSFGSLSRCCRDTPMELRIIRPVRKVEGKLPMHASGQCSAMIPFVDVLLANIPGLPKGNK